MPSLDPPGSSWPFGVLYVLHRTTAPVSGADTSWFGSGAKKILVSARKVAVIPTLRDLHGQRIVLVCPLG